MTTSEPDQPHKHDGDRGASGVSGGIAHQPARLSAREIAHALGLNPPTDEQVRIIESPLEPRLVIAGAGSGKTATMVDRVVWLVANKIVRADEVLGVTFTRKAAGELRDRMRTRLNILRERNLIELSEEELLAGSSEPTVSTYHSYANNLVKEYGLRLGVEQDAQMLGDAQAWQLAAQIVQYWDGDLPAASSASGVASKSTIVQSLLQLSGECAEHLVSPQQVIEFCSAHLAAYESLSSPGPSANAKKVIERLKAKIILAQLVQRYARVKARMQVLDYGDLIALAARIAREVPAAAQLERERYKVVLLDEFQDTSHAQLRLFADLYGARDGHDGRPGQPEHPVMAVGDPKQSIYGFRGASDGQLFSFYQYFPTRDETPLYLTVAWRNDVAILDAANLIAAKLKNIPEWVRAPSPPHVPDLRPRSVILNPDEAGYRAMLGSVQLARYGSETEEAQGIAERIVQERARYADTPAQMPTMAVLTRTRAQMEPIRQACESLGVPVQVVGLGGLLERPEIIDMVSMLRVLADPNRSDALMRLLAGARWRLGTADLLALGDWSNYLTTTREKNMGRTFGEQPSEETSGDVPSSPQTDTDANLRAAHEEFERVRKNAVEDLAEYGSLIEAIEHLPVADEAGNPIYPADYPESRRRLSVEGLRRLHAFTAEVEYLRQFTTEDIGTLLYEIERVMLLDIELAARPGGDAYGSRAHLDAFHEVAASYAASSPRINAMLYAGADGTEVDEDAPTARRFVLSANGISYLLGFLSWLEQAQNHERGLTPAEEEPRRDAVQILTMHASKGLEWDHVYLPRMCDKYPTRPHTWHRLEHGSLPWPLRGDRDYLPSALERAEEVSALENYKELNARLEDGEDMANDYVGFEGRRLVYVAMTRARSLLHISNCRWVGPNVNPYQPEPYWNELVQFAQGDAEEPYEGIQVAPWLYPGYLGTGFYTSGWAIEHRDASIEVLFGRCLWLENYSIPQGIRLENGTSVPVIPAPDDPEDTEASQRYISAVYEQIAHALVHDGGNPITNAEVLNLPEVHRVKQALMGGVQEPDLLETQESKEAYDENLEQLKKRYGLDAVENFRYAREPLAQLAQGKQGPEQPGVRPQIVHRFLEPAAWVKDNPQQGSVLTADWPFDPFDGAQVIRWASEKDLAERTENRDIIAVPGQRRARVERAALNVARGSLSLDELDKLTSPTEAEAQQIQDWEHEVDLLLALAQRAVTPAVPTKPEHMSASTLIALSEDKETVLSRLVRPVPMQPSAAARQGTLFHAWVEEYFGDEPMLDLQDELYSDDDLDGSFDLEKLRATFLESEWASRTIWRAEYPVETHVAGVNIRGRIDAVFRRTEQVTNADGTLQEQEHWDLVDWKTGRKPSAHAMRHKRIQLALYRLAFAKIQGIDPERVHAAFYYVGSDQTVWDTDIAGGLQNEQQLERIISRAGWGEELPGRPR